MNYEEIKTKINERLTDGTGQCSIMGGRCNIGGICYYRLDNNACVVGCLIPDEYYNEKMEGAGISNVEVSEGKWVPNSSEFWFDRSSQYLAKALNKSGIPATLEIKLLLADAQNRHDNKSNWAGNKYIGELL